MRRSYDGQTGRRLAGGRTGGEDCTGGMSLSTRGDSGTPGGGFARLLRWGYAIYDTQVAAWEAFVLE
jgi:hypothetical protein